jgi:hypothetical protein
MLFRVPDHLIIPFGSPKWAIDKIRIAGVSTDATYFASDTPTVYIDKAKKAPLRLVHFPGVFPGKIPDDDDQYLDVGQSLAFIRDFLRTKCELQTDFERRFLDLYFSYVTSRTEPNAWEKRQPRTSLEKPKDDPLWVFAALLPLPQAHLYLSDPLSQKYSFVPENMVKVDFAFWTGEHIVAIEIDGGSHIGSRDHIRKDRMLNRSGVLTIHIMNDELLEHGEEVIRKLLPTEVTKFAATCKSVPDNPIHPIPF